MIVCLCRNVSDRAIARAIDRGARTVSDVARATGAGTSCGCCRATVEALLEARSPCESGGCDACPRRAAAASVEAP